MGWSRSPQYPALISVMKPADIYGYIVGGAKLGGLTVLIYVISIAIYRIFFHPLAKYPGPFWSKVLDIRAAYQAWTGDLHVDIWRCHQKYGDYVRYGPDHLMINTPTGMREIYGLNGNYLKAPEYGVMVHRAPSTFTCLDKKEHARKRRVLSQAFSMTAIKSYQPQIKEQLQKFCSQVCPIDENLATGDKGWSAPVNISQWCDYLFFDVITQIVFGTTYDLLGSEKYRYIIHAIEASNVRLSVLVQMPILMMWKLDKKLFPRAIVARNLFLRFMKGLVGSRMTAVGRKDAFSILQECKDPETGKGLHIAEIGAEATTLLVAGSDTSSTLAATLFFYLGHHPEVYAKMMSEVRGCFDSVDEIEMGPKLTSCTYLRACIQECLRMSPPVGAGLMRAVPPGGATIDGQYVPGGMLVGTGIYSSHHTETNFSDSFEFQPERWLGSSQSATGGKAEIGTEGYMPFSMGTRSCIGKGLALVEATMLMATVCMLFDFQLADSKLGHSGGGHSGAAFGRHRPDEFQLADHITSAKDGPLVQFRRRQVS